MQCGYQASQNVATVSYSYLIQFETPEKHNVLRINTCLATIYIVPKVGTRASHANAKSTYKPKEL